MAKNYIDRYVWLIDVINSHGHIPFSEISDLWAHCSTNKLGENYLPERTFHNHRAAILDTFGIEIKCDRSLGYYIANTEDLEGDGVRQRLLEAITMSNMLNETKEMRERILFERVPSSQKWLSSIINAMRSGKAVEMTYQSFLREEPSTYAACPWCLKLFKQRWYMLAKTEGYPDPRIYALDERMVNVVLTDKSYRMPARFDAEKYFADYFGIIVGAGQEPRDVKIRVSNDQARYFDSLPLHGSQMKVAGESDESHTVYSYHLATTYDFKKEILSCGASVEVVSPEDFKEEIAAEVLQMAANYGLPIAIEKGASPSGDND